MEKSNGNRRNDTVKNAKKLIAFALSLCLALSACTKTEEPKTSQQGEDTGLSTFVDWVVASEDLTTFLIQHSESEANARVLCNNISPLLEYNNHGVLGPAVAKEWESDETGETWTFRLREDVTWVDASGEFQANCTAHDWATAMEWILNYHKNGAANTAMPFRTIAGAQEYYDYTKGLSEEEGKALKATDSTFTDVVGVEVPDDYTLIYHCNGPVSYFDTLTACACLYPLSQAQIDKQGVDAVFAQQPDTMWYNGPYLTQNFIRGNSKDLVRNESYWDKDCKLFDRVTILVLEDGNKDDALFETGEVDRTQLHDSTLRMIYENEDHPYHDQLVMVRGSLGNQIMMFNYAKNKEDGTPDMNWNEAVANEAFRLSLYYGMDLYEFWASRNYIDPASCQAHTFSISNLSVFSDGKDYTERVKELLNYDTEKGRYDEQKGQQYKEQAMKELEGKVTFPVEVDYYVASGNQSQLDAANVLKGCMESLGTDYIQFNIKTFVSSIRNEVNIPSLHSISIGAWGADYGDPQNFLTTIWSGDDGASWGVYQEHINEATTAAVDAFAQFSDLARQGMEITGDKDERYEQLAQAEAYAINHALIIPLRLIGMNWSLTKTNAYAQPYASYGVQRNMYKNWQTSQEPYTTEEYKQFQADFEAGKI